MLRRVRRSLALKWVLTLLLTSLIGVVLVGVFASRTARQGYDQLRLEEAQASFTESMVDFYRLAGSWDGVEEALFGPMVLPAAHLPPPDVFDVMPRLFAIVDEQGRVVVPFGPFQAGDTLPDELVSASTSIEVDGRVVGRVLTIEPAPGLAPREQRYIDSLMLAVWGGAVGAVVAAVLVGVLLSRQFLNPLNDLTTAITAIRRGDLSQRVTVRTLDELGTLAEAFNQMSADISRSNRLRKQMTADIAHDLRTPLMVLAGYLEALHDETLKPTPARFEAMQAEVTLLRRLIDDLRVLSLADAGELPLHRQPIHPVDLLVATQKSFEPMATEAGIQITCESELTLPRISVDHERMGQVLGNLMTNALRYTPPNGKVHLCAQHHPRGVRLTISDNGSGIAPDDLPNIFERLYRADESRTHSQTESGLGLAIAKAIIEAHGGQITAESTLGEGTRIMITLPALTPPAVSPV
ncbi:MAG: ATP-binding protein [Anaerolineae bacterium]|jgi:signal transduction histidine kinase|nr:ATP-binding protein [Anaerolineae bacterium]